ISLARPLELDAGHIRGAELERYGRLILTGDAIRFEETSGDKHNLASSWAGIGRIHVEQPIYDLKNCSGPYLSLIVCTLYFDPSRGPGKITMSLSVKNFMTLIRCLKKIKGGAIRAGD